jgi:hypothetical protein
MPIHSTNTHLVTALFEDLRSARRVVQDLRRSGIPDRDISIISSGDHYSETDYRTIDGNYFVDDDSHTEEGAEVGAAVGGVGGFVVGLTTVTIPGVGPVLALGNILASTITGAAVGGLAGGIIGLLIDLGVPEERAHLYQEGIRHGHVLVAAQSSPDDISRIKEVFGEHRPVDLHNRSESWEKETVSKAGSRR